MATQNRHLIATAVANYFAGLDAYSTADLTGMSVDDELEFCDNLYGPAERLLASPPRVDSAVDAHALIRFLMHDNASWGQEAWKPIFAALEDYLRREAEAESKGGRSNG